MLRIATVKIPNEISQEQLQKLVSIISYERQCKCISYKRKDDIYRCVIAELLLREMLEAEFEEEFDELSFGVNEYGKPHLLNFENIHYNLSHSGMWVAASLANMPVGIDIEHMSIDNPLPIARRYFTSAEYELLCSRDEDEMKETFYTLWTMKESYIKQQGRGLQIPLNSFTFSNFDDSVHGHVVERTGHERVYYSILTSEIGYKMALCYPMEISESHEITYYETNSLLEKWLNRNRIKA